MSQVYVCGDLHGTTDFKKLTTSQWPEQKKLTKEDYLIQLGDFGMIWKNVPDKEEKYWLKNLDDRPFTTLFLDGNHDNHPRLQALPRIEMFGGEVGVASESVFHLRRGEVYTIGGKTFFVCGGAASTDRQWRVVDVSWWAGELLTFEETDKVILKAQEVKKVDFVLTHTCPQLPAQALLAQLNLLRNGKTDDPTCRVLDEVDHTLDYTSWHFGHFHTDRDVLKDGKFFCHYNHAPTRLV